jgi:hypothetical protein
VTSSPHRRKRESSLVLLNVTSNLCDTPSQFISMYSDPISSLFSELNSCAYLVGRGVPGAPRLCDGQIEILDGVPRRRNRAHIIHVTTGNELAESNHSMLFLCSVCTVWKKRRWRLPVQPHSQSGVDKPRERWHHGHRSFFPVPVQVTTDQITRGLRHTGQVCLDHGLAGLGSSTSTYAQADQCLLTRAWIASFTSTLLK